MRNKLYIAIVLSLCLIAVLILIPREDPASHVSKLWQYDNNSDWGNVKVLDVQRLDGYTAVSIQYEARSSTQFPDRWMVKDRVKLKDIGTEFSKWEGHVYLIKKGVRSWRVVR